LDGQGLDSSPFFFSRSIGPPPARASLTTTTTTTTHPLSTHTKTKFDTIATIITRLCDRHGWTPVLEGGAPIGATRGAASVSIEPGGQFELSGAPLADLHATADEAATHLKELRDVSSDLNAAFLALGFDPAWANEDVPPMPKARYRIMSSYMPRVGQLGRDMMFRSATIQVNLDFDSEADMVSKFRVGLGLQPIATALFSNSPFRNGAPSGYKSWRSHVWEDTDADRTGILPWAWDDSFGFASYADYAAGVPMYFRYEKGKGGAPSQYVDATAARFTFRDWMNGKTPPGSGEGAPTRPPTLADWETHLTTIFPEVRLKRYLEMRGADGGPLPAIAALPALWVGLLYDEAALAECLDLVTGWSGGDHERLRAAVPKAGLAAPAPASFGPNKTVAEVARRVVGLASAGLARRGRGEEALLAPLVAAAESGQSGADRLLALYEGPWARSIDPVYSPDFSY
jgi:glutamate--cysteine ligase